MSGTWRMVFLGTPEFAGPSLLALAGAGYDLALVVTQPDRPKGRGRSLTPPPVKTLAEKLGLPVWQPQSIKTPEASARLKVLAPDLLVVVAFGQILPPAVLAAAGHGAVNVHPSLLPAYRGPAPINWAIINGETETGVTTMLLDEGMDTGPILLSRTTAIGAEETAGELHDRLAGLGAELLLETVKRMKEGGLSPRPQPVQGACPCRRLEKPDGLLDWNRPAEELCRLVRGLDPWPGAYTFFRGRSLRLFGARPGPGRGRPGQVLALEEGRLHVAAGRGSLALKEAQVAGGKRQAAAEFWNGQRLSPADCFGI
ncbi:MAG: methionyl-tRNA formyltransferase [Thermodesulfobacteriota bacterium]